MICCFCAGFIDGGAEEACAADWIPTFFMSGAEFFGPVCPDCVGPNLDYDADSATYALKAARPAPPLALPLQGFRNRQEPPDPDDWWKRGGGPPRGRG